MAAAPAAAVAGEASAYVTVPLAVLRDGLGAATLDDGAVVSATTARRLACDAESRSCSSSVTFLGRRPSTQ